ncbi:hypothetical protein [Brevundimonas sp.]|uniref:hypothetical protein n=1 Tax=Brevundimonas sp. TaxID=1871086 RepID=UPI0037BF1E43
MAFVTDKEELKPGLVIFRRGDLQSRDWYCRVRLPKATRYKTIALKTPDITTARSLAYDHESEVRFALKRNLPVFNRPFSAVAKDYIAEQRLRVQRGEITMGRVKLIESVVKNQLNPYVGKTQIDLIALDRWQNYPSWRRSLGQGRMTRHGNVRPMTETERSAAKEVAAGKAKERLRRNSKPHLSDAVLCSLCFSNEGLKLDAERIGTTSSEVCPTCGSNTGLKLDRHHALWLVHRFFVVGSLHKTEYGGAPVIQFNVMRKNEIDPHLYRYRPLAGDFAIRELDALRDA